MKKFLTLNTHSLVEPEYGKKLELCVKQISEEIPDVIAMQEVSQTADAEILPERALRTIDGRDGYFRPAGSDWEIRANNHAANVAKMLGELGHIYFWTWIPIKLGYGKYDEGIAIFSREPILQVDVCRISKADDYNFWKTRKVIGIQTGADGDWFYSVHMGWWDDEEEPFTDQWKTLKQHVSVRQTENNRIWLMGDFNSPSQVRGQGYDLILSDGWKDSYMMAEQKDSGITVEKIIDGWENRLSDESPKDSANRLRMDHIFCSREVPVVTSEVLFNGRRGPIVSDHYGVMITLEKET